MADCERFEQGQFSWVDLGTPDLKASKSFYTQLFGWRYDDQSLGSQPYAMAKLGVARGDCAVAGIYTLGDPAGANRPQWTSYVTVDNVDETTKRIASSGGRVLKEPHDIYDAGRTALVEDPAGGVFALWTPKKNIGAGIVGEPGALTWNELVAPDIEKATAFYSRAIGWKSKSPELGKAFSEYTMLTRDGSKETSSAGIMSMGPRPAFSAQWLAYFGVADCDASARNAHQLGGRVLHAPTDVQRVGRFSIIQDPHGATFALLQSSMPTPGQLKGTKAAS